MVDRGRGSYLTSCSGAKTGQLAVLEREGRFIYYLVHICIYSNSLHMYTSMYVPLLLMHPETRLILHLFLTGDKASPLPQAHL